MLCGTSKLKSDHKAFAMQHGKIENAIKIMILDMFYNKKYQEIQFDLLANYVILAHV